MDQRERSQDFEETLRAHLDARQAKTWTAMPGIIESFNAATMTAVVQPAVKGRLTDQKENVTLVVLPLCLDVPVQFPAGGGATLTFPVAKGDECLLVFASRPIDSWWQSGGVQAPVEARMHDLSDAHAILGIRSQPRVLSGISTTSTQLRSDDGSTVIDLNPTTQTTTMTAPGGATIDANVKINGTLHVTGQITSDTDVVAGGSSISLVNHVHGDVQSGSSNTGAATG